MLRYNSLTVDSMVGAGLAEGLEPALQGVATFLTNSSRNSQLFATVAICDTLAELIGGPIAARLIEIGRAENHPSDGYCFLASCVSFKDFSIYNPLEL